VLKFDLGQAANCGVQLTIRTHGVMNGLWAEPTPIRDAFGAGPLPLSHLPDGLAVSTLKIGWLLSCVPVSTDQPVGALCPITALPPLVRRSTRQHPIFLCNSAFIKLWNAFEQHRPSPKILVAIFRECYALRE
jgi:hypothetical protein